MGRGLLVGLVRLALLGGGHLGDRGLVRRLRLRVLGLAQILRSSVRSGMYSPRRCGWSPGVAQSMHDDVLFSPNAGAGSQPVRDEYPRHRIDAEHHLARRRQRARGLRTPSPFLATHGRFGEEVESRVAASFADDLPQKRERGARAAGALVSSVALEQSLKSHRVRGRLRPATTQPAVSTSDAPARYS